MTRPRWLGGVAVALVVAAVVYRGELAAWVAGEPGAPAVSGAPVAYYTCSMDPSVESDHPGACPICGMALTPVTRADRASGIVRISARVRKRIALRVAPVETRVLHERVVASGEVVEQAGAAADRAQVAAQVYRGDPREAQPGRRVEVMAPDLPLLQFSGTIARLLPTDAPGALRVEVDNPDRALTPGTHVEIQIDRELPPRLVVPEEAVVYAGTRRIVFVDLGSGRFAPRTPKLGVQADGFVEVVGGLTARDQVVVDGTFLLAAESRIRSDGALWSDRVDPAPGKRRASDRRNPP